MDTNKNEYVCVDKEELHIYGDYNSVTTRVIEMQLVKCTGFDYCAKDEIIRDFLRNKFLLFLYNEKVFDSSFLAPHSIVKQARIEWIPVNTQY